MAYTSTEHLNLRKDDGDEKYIDFRPHTNNNLDIIDGAIEELDSRCRGRQTWGNLKETATWGELIGNDVSSATNTTTNLELIKPGYDNVVDVASFNTNMDTLDSAIGDINVSTDGSLQSQISSLRDSVDGSFLGTGSYMRVGNVVTINSGWMSASDIPINTAYTLCTLPLGFAPKHGYAIAPVMDGTALVGRIIVSHNRELGIMLSKATGHIEYTITYLSA